MRLPRLCELGGTALAAALLVSTAALGDNQTPPVSEAQSPGQAFEKKERFFYRPIEKELWARAERLIEEQKSSQVPQLWFAASTSGPEIEERKLLMAKALASGGQRLHAQYLLTEVITKSIGTRQGFEALRLLHELGRGGELDEMLMEDLAFDLDTKIDEPESRSMIGYYRARALVRKGYEEWARLGLGEIAQGSTWKNELLFEQAQQALVAGDSGAAYAQFEAILNNPATRASTARLARLDLARLLFEKRDFKAAMLTYVAIELPTRERARSLNELAWSYYYERSYGKALGAIRALKSKYYNVLVSPETFILEMLIYRELCHFKRVKEIAGEFNASFKPVFGAIEARRPLETVPQFLQMLIQEGVLQKRANAIQAIRVERRTLERQRWTDEGLRTTLLGIGKKRERLIDAEITRMLRTRSEAMANWFLDFREQVWFLDYEASMRMIQMNEAGNAEYEPPKASALKPDVIFWPGNQEAWKDELLDYENLVPDACKASPLMKIGPGGGAR